MKNNTDKLVEYLDEAKKLGIEVMPPEINASLVDFAVTEGKIRFGLAAVKGVGEASVRNILESRDRDGAFKDLFDLTHRVDTKHVNRRVLEALTKCGALDSLPGHRAQLLAALDLALEAGSRAALDREMGQASLFGALESPSNTVRPQLPLTAPIGAQTLLAWEKETLGVYISGHPLADVAEALGRTGATPLKDLRGLEDDAAVTVGGMLTSVRRTVTRAQQQMLIATLEDVGGSVELVVFPKSYPQLQAKFIEDATVIVRGRLKFRERRGASAEDDSPPEINIAVNDLSTFDRAALRPAPAIRAWHVTVSTHDQVDELAKLLESAPGPAPVVLHAGSFDQPMPRSLSAEPAVRSKLEAIFGSSNVRVE